MRFAYVSLIVVAGCDFLDPCGGPAYLSFAVVRHGMLPNGTPTLGSQAPLWGQTETMNAASDELEILFSQDDALSPDVLELYGSDGARLVLAGNDMFVPTDVDGCAHNERHYALATLPVADYTLVHRRKHGTGDPLNCIDLDCPWTTFDGDQAVTLTLAIR